MRTPRVPLLLCFVLTAACGTAGSGGDGGPGVPNVAPPKLSPVALLPPAISTKVPLGSTPVLTSFQTDLFTQANGVVDILWLIDDSGKMADERLVLGSDFQGFLTELTNIQSDYQIGVTNLNASADGGSEATLGQLRASVTVAPGLSIITPATPNAAAVFQELTTFPDSRLHWDLGLRTAELALTPPNASPGGSNAGFVRPNAALAAIVVSNSDDASYADPDYSIRFFQGVKGPGNERLVTFSTIAGDIPNGCTPAADVGKFGGMAEPAVRYAAVSFGTGGVVGSICDTDFAGTLQRVVEALNTLRRVFPLTVTPVAGTLSVTVNGTAIPQDVVNGWQYQAGTNSILFEGAYIPPPGANIQILYAISS
ncbi:MAG: VWA domain-containing protein [Myxococcaceae bacterium]